MSKEKGLTMIELLLTIAILVATVTAVLALGNRAVAQTGLFATHTQATFLAKEALEILEDKNTRDQINIDGSSFWKVDYLTIENVGSEQECYEKLGKSDIDSFFVINGIPNSETNFSRCLKAQKTVDELKIEVDVAFDYKNNDYNIKLYRVFYD